MRTFILVLAIAAGCAQAQTPKPEETAQTATVMQTAEDSVIFARTIERAYAERVDTLPIGEAMVTIGEWFVGSPYVPGSLEQPGPERLVINLREFDCVTFVENMLAFARTVRAGRRDFASFKNEIQKFRYRAGKIDGYPSRLHYFSEWIADNEAKGILTNVTPDIGVRDPEPIDFMSTHRKSY